MSRNLNDVDWTKLPAPTDDGGAQHLKGKSWPALDLASTSGGTENLSTLAGTTVVYIYPRTGRPDQELPPGWNDIPGARGCTPQSCAFRDHYAELSAAGASRVFGLSRQDTAYQKEARDRLHLPFELLSDHSGALTQALDLPTFTTSGMTLLKRMTLMIRDGRIVDVHYPVFPPDADATWVLNWLKENGQ